MLWVTCLLPPHTDLSPYQVTCSNIQPGYPLILGASLMGFFSFFLPTSSLSLHHLPFVPRKMVAWEIQILFCVVSFLYILVLMEPSVLMTGMNAEVLFTLCPNPSSSSMVSSDMIFPPCYTWYPHPQCSGDQWNSANGPSWRWCITPGLLLLRLSHLPSMWLKQMAFDYRKLITYMDV